MIYLRCKEKLNANWKKYFCLFYVECPDLCKDRIDGSSILSPNPLPYHRLATAMWSCPPSLQVSGCADYLQVLDTRQILALSSVSVGCLSKPRYRIGACQLAQLAFGKTLEGSHGTSFALMVPDKPADLSCLPLQKVG